MLNRDARERLLTAALRAVPLLRLPLVAVEGRLVFVVAPLRLVRIVTRLVDRIADDFSNALQ